MGQGAHGLGEWFWPSRRGGFPIMRGFLPGVGHAPGLHFDALAALRRAEREQGPLVQVSLGFGQWLVFCFGADGLELLKHPAVRISGSRKGVDYLMGGSLLTLDGAPHRRIRSAMNPTFSARGLAESTAAERSRETVQRHARAFVDGGGGDAHERALEMTLDVIFRIVGVDIDALDAWRAAYQRALWGFIPVPLDWPGTPRYFARRATVWIDAELRRLVRRATAVEGRSIVHALLRSRDEDGEPLSEDDLVANLRILFLAAHETTATTMTWALVELAKQPGLMRRIQAEVDAAGGEAPRTPAEAKRLPLCEAVFREAVRLYGPVWFIERSAGEELTWHGARIPAGTPLALPALLWARDPELYPDPDTFNPDRWLGRPGTPTPYELSQFGGGPHFCLGYHLSWLESLQFLAALAGALSSRKAQLRLAAGRAPKVVYFPTPRPSPAARVVVEAAGH